eukprot:gene16200-16378_t
MPYAAFKTGLSLLLASMLCVVLGSAAAAQASAPFAYKMYVTPEAGPDDPVVERRYTPEFAACQAKAQITRESAQCFEDEFDRQDARLNQAWKAALRNGAGSQGANPSAKPSQTDMPAARSRQWSIRAAGWS